MDRINVSISFYIFSRTLCIEDQVIMRRSLRVCGRCGVQRSLIMESQIFMVPIDHRSCGVRYRAGVRAVPDGFCASDLLAVLVFPSYIDSGHIYIVCMAVIRLIRRILESKVRGNSLAVNVSPAAISPKILERQVPLELRRHGCTDSARPVFSVQRVVQFHFNLPVVAVVMPPQFI